MQMNCSYLHNVSGSTQDALSCTFLHIVLTFCRCASNVVSCVMSGLWSVKTSAIFFASPPPKKKNEEKQSETCVKVWNNLLVGLLSINYRFKEEVAQELRCGFRTFELSLKNGPLIKPMSERQNGLNSFRILKDMLEALSLVWFSASYFTVIATLLSTLVYCWCRKAKQLWLMKQIDSFHVSAGKLLRRYSNQMK